MGIWETSERIKQGEGTSGHLPQANLGHKQEELQLHVRSQNSDAVGVTETWWDSSYGWSVVKDDKTQERQAEEMVWWPLCEGAAWMYGSAVGDAEWAG